MKSRKISILILAVCIALLAMAPIQNSLFAQTYFQVICKDLQDEYVEGLTIIVHYYNDANPPALVGGIELTNTTQGYYKATEDELPEDALFWELWMEIGTPIAPDTRDWWQGVIVPGVLNDAGIWIAEEPE